jgi:hypothetical protein
MKLSELHTITEGVFPVTPSMLQFIDAAIMSIQKVWSGEIQFEEGKWMTLFTMPVSTAYGAKPIEFQISGGIGEGAFGGTGTNWPDRGRVRIYLDIIVPLSRSTPTRDTHSKPPIGPLRRTILHELVHCFDPAMSYPSQGAVPEGSPDPKPGLDYHNLPIEKTAEIAATAFWTVKRLLRRSSKKQVARALAQPGFLEKIAQHQANARRYHGITTLPPHHIDTYLRSPRTRQRLLRAMYQYLQEE